MATDIHTQLAAILNEIEGEAVAINAASAIETLNHDIFARDDIAEYLVTIRSKPFGKDIRYAIYESLRRLSLTERVTPTNIVTDVITDIPGVAFGTVGEMEEIQDGN